MVPRVRIRPELPRREHQAQNHGLTENSDAQATLIRSEFTQKLSSQYQDPAQPTACKLQCWTPQAKQPARQEHSPTHQKKRDDKNMVQTKEQCSRNLQDKINEEETGNLPEKEFRV